MALHPQFPKSPYAILEPKLRWFPAEESLRASSYEKLLPPLVHQLRGEVKRWRDAHYEGASSTSIALLNWWFKREHLTQRFNDLAAPFHYYFSQREALETIVYLYDVVQVKDRYDLMRFDASGAVSAGMFAETWRRFVIKMATGSGKTKVMSLVLVWSYFHKQYEEDSDLARNFLVITPNIIVLDRIRSDFDGLRIFFNDPLIPENGYEDRAWQDDFQLSLHIQDEARVTHKTGNIFLTNIHRVYLGNEKEPSFEDDDLMDYFLGKRPTGATTDSKIDLGQMIREVDELVVINDEAHHIHDEKLAWFKSIEDIHHKLLQKDKRLSLQIDVTATPKHNNGSIFVQTVSDYPLVEAISQNVVKHPVLPDAASRAKLAERQSSKYTEKYADYLDLGVEEWRKAYAEHEKMGKKAILFVMTDDTKNCDDVADYLRLKFPELNEGVLVIHTKNNGEVSESTSGKSKEDLEQLRSQANFIDGQDNPYKAIVSVLMLKEGWDVRNVTTIVGLRAYSSKSNILPEQTLGRGLRKMYPGNEVEEYVSVVGTDAFMEFVESIQSEGVELERKPMGGGAGPIAPLIVEVDLNKSPEDLVRLNIEIPILSPRLYREFSCLSELDVSAFGHKKVAYKQFGDDAKREIIFRDVTTQEETHTTVLDAASVKDYRVVIGFFAQSLMKEMRLVSGYDVLYGKVKEFVQRYLFEDEVDLENHDTLRNLAEVEATKTLVDTFRKKINELTVKDYGKAETRETISLRKMRPFVVKEQRFLRPKKSVFNRIVGDSSLELEFAAFLDSCEDIISYAKNYFALKFKIDYVNPLGGISEYVPDFIVKKAENEIYIVETKGRVDMDVPLKMARLKQWVNDINSVQNHKTFGFVFVDEASFETYRPKRFIDVINGFREYQS